MKYMGSKARHAKALLPIILASRREDQIYVEPFVGGGNVINKVPQGAGRLASDSNGLMVTLLDQLGNHGWTPPETLTEAEWSAIRHIKPVTPAERALHAFCATGPCFSGKWWGGWARGNNDRGEPRDYVRESRTYTLKGAPGLRGVKFTAGDYQDLDVPQGALVYCDPPYAGTTAYSGAGHKWDADRFWQWCDDLIDTLDCTVFVSEYRAPPHWPSVWEKQARSDLSVTKTDLKRETEHLFHRSKHETDINIRGVDRVLCSESRGAGRPLVD